MTTVADAREFRRLCREGMLFEVQAWIAQGKVLPAGGEAKESPLAVAAGLGFHSLVKVLLDAGFVDSEEIRNAALARAGAGGHLEVCRLLLERGAKIDAVPAAAVLECGNPECADFLVEAGLDLETDFPLAKALMSWSGEALDFFKRWKRRKRTVRIQGAMALAEFVREENLARVRWLKRAGADPRLNVPRLEGPAKEHLRETGSALDVAMRSRSLSVVRDIGVRDADIGGQLEHALNSMDPAKVLYLLHRGVKINDQANGGSTILNRCLCELRDRFPYGGGGEDAWILTQKLVQMGARWMPDKKMMHDTRLFLRYATSQRLLDVARLLIEGKAADRATVRKLFWTRGILRRVNPYQDRLEAILGM